MLRDAARPVRRGQQDLGDQARDVRAGHPRVHLAAALRGAPARARPGAACREVLRHRGPGRGAGRRGQRGHVPLARREQGGEQAQPGRVGEHPQHGRCHLFMGVTGRVFLQVTGICNVVACAHEHILWKRGGRPEGAEEEEAEATDEPRPSHPQLAPTGCDTCSLPALDAGATRWSTRPWRPPVRASGRCGSRWRRSAPPPRARAWSSGSSGSVALLGDTLHNVADALTAVPLGIAFLLGRRAANRRVHLRLRPRRGPGRNRHRAGHRRVGRARRLRRGRGACSTRRPMTRLPWVAAAGLIGFAGNELVARYRMRVGRRIGSAALVADGLHARTDGYTSLAVVLARRRRRARLALGRPGHRPAHHGGDRCSCSRTRPGRSTAA